MEVKVTVDIERAGEMASIELTQGNGGVVDVVVPSVGTQRICRFSVVAADLESALSALER